MGEIAFVRAAGIALVSHIFATHMEDSPFDTLAQLVSL